MNKLIEAAQQAAIILETSQRRFELLAAHDDTIRNGARPSSGAQECKEAAVKLQKALAQPESEPTASDTQINGCGSFSGGNTALVAAMVALLKLDAAGALVPHGIGGHARALLTAAASRLAEPVQPESGPSDREMLISKLREAFAQSTRGEWQKGQTTHHTVTETGYKIAEFHHASDAQFCDTAHKMMPLIIDLLEADAQQAFGDLTGVKPCCGEYATCCLPCTPRGRWEAQQVAVPQVYKAKSINGNQHDTGRVYTGEGSFFADTASLADARLIANALNATILPQVEQAPQPSQEQVAVPQGWADLLRQSRRNYLNQFGANTTADWVYTDLIELFEGAAPQPPQGEAT